MKGTKFHQEISTFRIALNLDFTSGAGGGRAGTPVAPPLYFYFRTGRVIKSM